MTARTIFKDEEQDVKVVERLYQSVDGDTRETRIFEVTYGGTTYAYTSAMQFHSHGTSGTSVVYDKMRATTFDAIYWAMIDAPLGRRK